MEENFKMLAKTFYGFEEILEKEVRLLGGKNIQKGNRVVSFEGDLGFLYKANLSLRNTLKILKPIHSERVQNEDRKSTRTNSSHYATSRTQSSART